MFIWWKYRLTNILKFLYHALRNSDMSLVELRQTHQRQDSVAYRLGLDGGVNLQINAPGGKLCSVCQRERVALGDLNPKKPSCLRPET